jgi:hypothetical protein
LAGLSGPFAPLATLKQSEEFKYPKVKFGRTVWMNRIGLIYDEWYEDFKEMIKVSDYKDETGTMNRFGDSVSENSDAFELGRTC